mgnify:FL=1
MTQPQTGHEMDALTMTSELWNALGGRADLVERVDVAGEGALPSIFAVSDFATAAIAAAGLAIAEWAEARSGTFPAVRVDRRLASLWFGFSIAPQGWALSLIHI